MKLMRIAWRTVGAIVTRVAEDALAGNDRLAGLRRIGIDEVSHKKGHRYLTVLVDHDDKPTAGVGHPRSRQGHSAHLLRPARDRAQCADHPCVGRRRRVDRRRRRRTLLERGALRRCLPRRGLGHRRPRRCPPPGVERRASAGQHRRQARPRAAARRRTGPPSARPGAAPHARPLRVVAEPGEPHRRQAEELAWIAKTDPRLHRAYLLKEGLRHVFAVKGHDGKEALDRWLSWARRCRIPAFVDLARKILEHCAAIDATLEHDLSNALIESTNTKIRLLQRMVFGFKSAQALIALAMLSLGGFVPISPAESLYNHPPIGMESFCDTPRVHLVWPGGGELGLHRRRVGGLSSSLAGAARGAQQPVEGGLRAEIDALMEQDRPHLRRREIDEPVAVQRVQDRPPFLGGQCARLHPIPLRDRCRAGRCRTGAVAAVVAGLGGADRLARRPHADPFGEGDDRLVGHGVDVGSVSALSEIVCKSACSFACTSTAKRALASSCSSSRLSRPRPLIFACCGSRRGLPRGLVSRASEPASGALRQSTR